MKTEILQAIIDNKSVQYKLSGNNAKWHNFIKESYERTEVYTSLFDACDLVYEWRIKPETKEIQAKLALMRSSSGTGLYTLALNSYEEAIELEENSTFFIKWLTDWIIFKIEV